MLRRMLLLLACAVPSAAIAQPAPQVPPGSAAPPGGNGAGMGAAPGVIPVPAHVDPGMNRQPPAAVRRDPMPVVRPPGSPGGNPDVVPK